MRRTGVIIVAVVLLLGGSLAPIGVVAGHSPAEETGPECEFPLTVEDATGETVTIDEPPERVVTTNPSAAQMMWEFGAEGKVVGVTKYASYLEGAENRTQISGEDGVVSAEKVIDADPDLVLAPNATDKALVKQLREAGLTVYHFPLAESLDDVSAHTARTGELTGECEGAKETLAWMDEQLSLVEEAVAGEERPTVLYAFYGFTAGNGTHIHDIIQTAGGENVAAQAGIEGYQPINEEIVVDADPNWIVLNSDDPALPDSDAINQTTAAQENKTVIVEIEHINQPAPWNVHAVVTLVKTFHPDAYAAAVDAHSNHDDAEDDTNATADSDQGDGSDSIPGFGPAVAVIALVGAVIAFRQRL